MKTLVIYLIAIMIAIAGLLFRIGNILERTNERISNNSSATEYMADMESCKTIAESYQNPEVRRKIMIRCDEAVTTDYQININLNKLETINAR